MAELTDDLQLFLALRQISGALERVEVFGKTIHGARSLRGCIETSQFCMFCDGANLNRPEHRVVVSALGGVICDSCAIEAAAAIAVCKRSQGLLDPPAADALSRERFRFILEHLRISTLGNMKLYFKVRQCTSMHYGPVVDVPDFLEFMKQSDALAQLRAVGVGKTGYEHLRKVASYLEKTKMT